MKIEKERKKVERKLAKERKKSKERKKDRCQKIRKEKWVSF